MAAEPETLEATARDSIGRAGGGEGEPDKMIRAEIDTSAPIESVKEAASRFGGMGFWKPTSHKPSEHFYEHENETIDVAKVEEQAMELERDLIVKERETLNVLKELESTKMVVEELKLKLQNEASEIKATIDSNSKINDVGSSAEIVEKGNHENDANVHHNAVEGLGLRPSSAPGLILLELKQAKFNLTRTTTDLADIRTTVDLYNKKIEKERMALEKTRQRLSANTSKISSLEEELSQKKQKVQLAKDTKGKGSSNDPTDIARELQRLSSETEQFKKVGEAAKTEVARAISEIEQTKTRIRTAEVRLVAAKKMKEAARASEAVALAEIKALSKSENENSAARVDQKSDSVTLTFEEYSSLVSKAQEAEEACQGKVVESMLQVDEANLSKTEILKRVEEATKEVKISKKALEEALTRVEVANRGKSAVEEALRKWRSEHGQRRRSSVHNATKFKNSCPNSNRKDTHLLDVNGLSLVNEELKPVNEELKPVLKPALSIGQILSRKLLLTEDYENGMRVENATGKRKVSLAQMLSNTNTSLRSLRKAEKENESKQLPAKRKKFGLARISLLVTKQSKKKKKQTASSGC